MRTALLFAMISLRLWGQPLVPPPFPGPPPEGHRWIMKMVPAQTTTTNRDGTVTVTTMTVVQSEPIPVEKPRWYTCIHTDGTTETNFGTFGQVMAKCGSGTQQFVNTHLAVVAMSATQNVVDVVWQFKDGFHTRMSLQTWTNLVHHTNDTSKSVDGGVGRVSRRSPIVYPPMPAPLLLKSKSAAMPIPKVLVQGPRLALYMTNLMGWDTNLLQPTFPVTNIVINIDSNAHSGTLNVYCTPAVAVYFQTQLGATYECEASDDFATTWLPGPPTPGTGGTVTVYDLPKQRRYYRVKQL